MLDRREEHVSVGNRPSSLQRVKIGAKRDGTLTAMQLESYGTGGVAAGRRRRLLPRACMYPIPNVLTEQYDVFTNAGPCAAFRAPGQVQGIFALEQSLDELAHATRDGPARAARQDRHQRQRRRARAQSRAPHRRRARRLVAAPAAGRGSGPIKRGIGMAQSQWAYIVHGTTACEVRIRGDGSVEAFSGAQDIGTGTRTILAQVVAEELGLRAEDSMRASATRVIRPARRWRQPGHRLAHAGRAQCRVSRRARSRRAPGASRWTPKPDAIVFQDGRVFARGRPERGMPFNEAVKKADIDEIVHRADRREDYDGYRAKLGDLPSASTASAACSSRRSRSTPRPASSRCERIVAVHDCGRPINPKLIESQIYGGVIQGVSYALYEERHLDPATGVQLNANIDQYKIVGSREVPAIEVHILEQLGRQSSTDARGVAEPANVATAAAIANAFYNATGKRIRTLPMTPANVLAALRADEERAGMSTFEWVDATSVEHAVALLADGGGGRSPRPAASI